MSGIADFHLAVVNPEVNRVGRSPFNNKGVVPGAFQIRPPVPAGARVAKDSGQGRFEANLVAGAGRVIGGGYRPGGKDDFVLRSERVRGRVHFIVDDPVSQASPPDVLPGQFGL